MIDKAKSWKPPDHWLRVTAIDSHTGGEPFRVITSGLPDLEGDTMLERRRFAKEKLDHIRRALMWEPRGHADMYGCILTPPVSPDAHTGVLFIHNEGFSTMCGHGIIALVTVLIETGMLEIEGKQSTVRIDTPAGLVTARAKVEGSKVRSVCFDNVPSFVLALDEKVNVSGLGEIRYDLAFGGAFYAYADVEQTGLTIAPENFRALIQAGMAIKRAVIDSQNIVHPFEDDLSFLYGTILSERANGAMIRNVCIFADGEVDRSPTGTGVSGRLALEFARGRIGLNQPLVIESIIGSRFTGRVARETTFGPHQAIIPRVEGSAFITGRHEFFIDPEDEFARGFFLR
jgi:trans-L-3-hydroxyproline dehydratase